LLDRLHVSLKSKIILEIGCGGTSTLYDIFGNNLDMYIGLDLSFNACRIGRRLIPKGLFIQGSAELLPLRHCSVDFIVAYGVLHHLPEHEEHLRNILTVLKDEGYWKMKIKAAQPVRNGIPEIGASPHNEWIDWGNLLKILNGNARLLDAWFEYSPLQALLIMLVYERLNVRSRAFARVVIALDRLWLMTIGKLHRSLGPAGVIYTIQRQGSRDECVRTT
jgi:SAM-dependent methyltransferase